MASRSRAHPSAIVDIVSIRIHIISIAILAFLVVVNVIILIPFRRPLVTIVKRLLGLGVTVQRVLARKHGGVV